MDALFAFPAGPVAESALMARHRMDDRGAAFWRRDAYQVLVDAFVIIREETDDGSYLWSLTDKGRRMMIAEEAAVLFKGDALPPVSPQVALPRTAHPMQAKPLSMGAVTMRVGRDGALDYRSIPSLMGGQRCA
jgi:hypothetical protein